MYRVSLANYSTPVNRPPRRSIADSMTDVDSCIDIMLILLSDLVGCEKGCEQGDLIAPGATSVLNKKY